MQQIPSPESAPHAPDAGVGLALPVGLGLFPLGLALGVVVVHAGLPWWWATVFATLVYAGSLEFVLVGMAATGVPIVQVAVTSLLVNSRHVFYALSFPLQNVRGRAARAYATFALTDEAFAITTSPDAAGWSSRRIVGLQFFFHVCWVSGATLGALLGSVVPVERFDGLEFALTGLFVVLTIEAYRERPDATTAVIAVVCGLGAVAVAPDQMLLVAFAVFTVVQVGRARRSMAGATP